MADKTGIPVVDDAIKSVRTQSNDEKVNNLVANTLNALITQSKGWLSQESGWVMGGELVQDVDGIRINPGVIRLHNYNNEDPRLTFVHFDGVTLIQDANAIDFYYVDATGVIQRSATVPEEHRTKVIIGSVGWVTSTTGIVFNYVNADAHFYGDSVVHGPRINKRRTLISEGSTGATIKISPGRYYYHGLRVKTNPDEPHVSALYPAQDPLSFHLAYQSGAGHYIETVPQTGFPLDVYDDGSGTDGVSPIAVLLNNWWTVDELYAEATTGTYVLAMGQAVYATSSDALDAVNAGLLDFNQNPALSGTMIHSHILRRGGAIDYTLTTDAIIHNHPTSL